jgi:predicted flap endonuclease-1-like 5' DNA nuclease
MTLLDAKLPELDETTAKALRLPVGITSPLWLMIGSAAMVGAAFFWATKWMQPTTVEAVPPTPKVLPKPEPEVEAAIGKAAEIVEEVVEAPVAVVEALVEAVPEPEVVIDPVIEAPVVALAPEAPVALEPDDLTVMTGIGPKMAAMLADKGITRFAQIAAWSEDEIVALDKELKLMGRVGREAWVAQAKRLAGV